MPLTDILYPRIRIDLLPAMVRISLLGAVLAGFYGALHDQVSFTISEEYFTKLKFHQFAYANFGFPPRVFAAEVGFLASWWVGLIAAWLMARMGLAEMTLPSRRTITFEAFGIVALITVLIGASGALLGVLRTGIGDLSGWNQLQRGLRIVDLRSFVIVADFHAASYFGALVGLIGGVIFVRCRRRPSVIAAGKCSSA